MALSLMVPAPQSTLTPEVAVLPASPTPKEGSDEYVLLRGGGKNLRVDDLTFSRAGNVAETRRCTSLSLRIS